MFICTLKASNIKFFAAVFCAVALLVALVWITGGGASDALSASAAPESAKISFENVRSNDDRIGFLRQFGWEVEPQALSETTLKLPAKFDDIMNEYNEIQRSQGLDLSKYTGNEVVRYSYAVKNYPGYEGEVLANLIVAKSRVVAGDVCSADPDGFISSLYRPDEAEKTTGAASAETEKNSGEGGAATETDVFGTPADDQANVSAAPFALPADAGAPSDGAGEIGDAAYDG